jgi:hypothetical protein
MLHVAIVVHMTLLLMIFLNRCLICATILICNRLLPQNPQIFIFVYQVCIAVCDLSLQFLSLIAED